MFAFISADIKETPEEPYQPLVKDAGLTWKS